MLTGGDYMPVYFIRTYDELGSPLVCSYDYSQWKELCKEFKASGKRFDAWEDVIYE